MLKLAIAVDPIAWKSGRLFRDPDSVVGQVYNERKKAASEYFQFEAIDAAPKRSGDLAAGIEVVNTDKTSRVTSKEYYGYFQEFGYHRGNTPIPAREFFYKSENIEDARRIFQEGILEDIVAEA